MLSVQSSFSWAGLAYAVKEAGAGFRSIAEPMVDTTSQFADVIIAVLGVAASYKRHRITERTAAGRVQAKARGVKLGNPDNLNADAAAKGRVLGAEAVKARAEHFATDLGPTVAALKGEGLTLQQVADRLNAEGYTTPRGGAWKPTQVKRVLDRATPDGPAD